MVLSPRRPIIVVARNPWRLPAAQIYDWGASTPWPPRRSSRPRSHSPRLSHKQSDCRETTVRGRAMSHPHSVEYRNRPLGAAVRYPNPSSFDPGLVVLFRIVDQDISALCMPPFFARLTAADLDLGAEICSPRRACWRAPQRSPLERQSGMRHGYLRHLAAVIEPQPEVFEMTIDAGLKPEGA
jgi:hypothetical protein